MSNSQLYSTPKKQKSQTNRLNKSLIEIQTSAAISTQPDELEYYNIPRSYTMSISKKDRLPIHYRHELTTRISDNYNSMESSFYKYIRSISNQQKIYDSTCTKNDNKMVKLNQMLNKSSTNKQFHNEKKSLKAKQFIKHSEETNQKHIEITLDMLKLQNKQIQEIKNNQIEFIKKKEDKQLEQCAIRIPHDQRISYIRQKNKAEEENNQLDINEENGEKLNERLQQVEQRYCRIIKDKKEKIQKQNQRIERIKKKSELNSQHLTQYYINKFARTLDSSIRNKLQIDISLDQAIQKKKINEQEKFSQVQENRDVMNQTFTDKITNCSCTSKANSPRKYFRLSSRMSVDEKMFQVSQNKEIIRESRERFNQNILHKHSQYSLTNSLCRTSESTMNNFRRRANFLTKEEFKFKS